MPTLKLNRTNIEKHVKTDPLNDTYFWDTEVTGFGIRVTKAGTASYVVQGRVEGSKKDMRLTIGPASVFEPDQARDVAREHLRSMRLGIDPREARKEQQVAKITLREVATAYMYRPGALKPSTLALMEWHIEQVFEKWKDRPLASITTAEVRARYEELATKGLRGKGPAPSSAGLAMVTLRTLMNWAREQYRKKDGTPIIAVNPVEVLKRDLKPAAPRTRHIDRRQIGQFWNWLTTARNAPGNNDDMRAGLDLVMFLLLTGARRNEGAMLEWRNVHLEDDLADCSWYIDDPKNGNSITLPLSSAAVAILKARQAANDQATVKSNYVFPSRSKAGHIMDTRAPLERFAKTIGMERLSAHDLRRTFVTIGVKACRLDIAKLELLTNHLPQTVTTKHYLETSDLRDYQPEVESIAAYIEGEARVAAAKANGENIVSLPQRA
jgi:integrase